jgi:uncharacterized phage protein gp47/JayE
MATIDKNGASVKTFRQYLDQITQAYLSIDPGWNLNSESPDGNAIEIWAEVFANVDEKLIRAHDSVDPDSAKGVALDRIARISGLSRQEATASTATVTFSGTDGVGIPAGTGVRNVETDTVWDTEKEVTISGGAASVGVVCNTLGAEPAGPGDLSEFEQPVSGVSSVTNNNSASLGRPREPDASLRSRRYKSVAAPSSNQAASLVGGVADVDGVKAARVYENFSSNPDNNGLGGHSIAIFADGGNTTAIAKAIANRKNPGCSLNNGAGFGATEVTENVETESGSTLDVTFFRPKNVDIFVSVEIDGDLSSSAVDELKEEIVEYASSELLGLGGGFDFTGFGVGEVVYAGKLYTPANRIVAESGSTSSLTIGLTSGSTSSNKIDPGFDGLAVFSTSNISVSFI